MNENGHVCASCQLGKYHSLPSKSNFSLATSPLEIISADIWALLLLVLIKVFYYISFLDPFSWHTWIFSSKLPLGFSISNKCPFDQLVSTISKSLHVPTRDALS